ncbi:hypothetical protein [Acidiferrobacter sp.]|uniref:hypothetical protein n=1 Tax=Acidiferrobacter sp. TaxID=1872107 RepID=UPI002631D6FF|nr:hypothetical protein [Acidiferrobacter sp.]
MRPLACRAHRDKPYAGSVGVFYGQNHPYFDQKSPGTPGNVVELLARNEKSVVFVNEPKASKTVGIMVHCEGPLSIMSERPGQKAHKKIRPWARINAPNHRPIAIFA